MKVCPRLGHVAIGGRLAGLLQFRKTLPGFISPVIDVCPTLEDQLTCPGHATLGSCPASKPIDAPCLRPLPAPGTAQMPSIATWQNRLPVLPFDRLLSVELGAKLAVEISQTGDALAFSSMGFERLKVLAEHGSKYGRLVTAVCKPTCVPPEITTMRTDRTCPRTITRKPLFEQFVQSCTCSARIFYVIRPETQTPPSSRRLLPVFLDPRNAASNLATEETVKTRGPCSSRC